MFTVFVQIFVSFCLSLDPEMTESQRIKPPCKKFTYGRFALSFGLKEVLWNAQCNALTFFISKLKE